VLSDRERETPHEMQRRFATEDPDFARSFEEIGRRDSHFSLQRAYGMPRAVYTAALVVSVAISMLMLLALAPWTALAFMALAIVIATVRFRRDEVRRVSPRSGLDHSTTREARPDHRR
jgi:Flp pilus assembly protein TadB